MTEGQYVTVANLKKVLRTDNDSKKLLAIGCKLGLIRSHIEHDPVFPLTDPESVQLPAAEVIDGFMEEPLALFNSLGLTSRTESSEYFILQLEIIERDSGMPRRYSRKYGAEMDR